MWRHRAEDEEKKVAVRRNSEDLLGLPSDGRVSSAMDSMASVIKLNDHNYIRWKHEVTAILQAKELWGIVSGAEELMGDDLIDRPFRKKDAEARTVLYRTLDDHHFNLVIGCVTAQEVWSTIKGMKEVANDTVKLYAHQKFQQLKFEDDMSIAGYLAGLNAVLNNLETVGDAMAETAIIAKVIEDLPAKYEVFRSTFRHLAIQGNVTTWAQLKVQLMSLEAGNTANSGASVVKVEPTALAANGRKTSRKKRNGPRSGTGSGTFPGQCHNCGQDGHWKRDCKKKDSQSRPGSSGGATDLSALTATAELVMNCSPAETWIADSGASCHMTSHREFFSTYTSASDGGSIRTAVSGNKLQVAGKGSIAVMAFDGKKWYRNVLAEVLHIPGLVQENLFSINALLDKGCRAVYAQTSMQIIDKNNRTVVMGYRKNSSLTQIAIKPVDEEGHAFGPTGFTSKTSPGLRMLHERLGHVGVDRIKSMMMNGSADGIDVKEFETFTCEGCLMGKMKRKSLKKLAATRSCKPGEFIHSDICGPMSVESLAKSRYFVMFKCEASGYRRVYTMRTKDQLLIQLKRFVIEVREETGNKIRRLRTDCGTEYLAKNVQEFLLDQGILHETSAPYIHEENGRAEREIQTLSGRARSMLKAAGLPDSMWLEAVNTAAYLSNRVTCSLDQKKTPYEHWFGKKPELDHLRIFGCDAYVHVPKENRKKADATSEKWILIGYHNTCKDLYRVWRPGARDVKIVRDVEFIEKCFKEDGPVTVDLLNDQEEGSAENGSSAGTSSGGSPGPKHDVSGMDPPDGYHSETETSGTVGVVDSTFEPRGRAKRTKKPEEQPEVFEQRTRGQRRQAMAHFALTASTLVAQEPTTVAEVEESEQKLEWYDAMDDEMRSLIQNKTWEPANLPVGKKAIKCRWIFKLKEVPGKAARFKARLVAKGFSQKEGIDYSETFAPVVRYESVRTILSICAAEDYEILQFDVKTAFLHGKIEEELYLEQPEGYDDGTGRVLRLKKSLYGLKQAPRQWNRRFNETLKRIGFSRSSSDYCVYTSSEKDGRMILVLYVDDGLLCGPNRGRLEKVAAQLKSEFEITVEEASCYVGLEITRDREKKTISIGQQSYIRKVIDRFRLHDAKSSCTPGESKLKLSKTQCPVSEEEKSDMENVPYRQAVGSLMFAMMLTRPDIAYEVGQVSKFLENPGRTHWKAVQRIIKYLIGTVDQKIMYGSFGSVVRGKRMDPGMFRKNILSGYSDSDHAANVDTRKSVGGYIMLLNGGPITWCSRSQTTVATSTVEAEYVAAFEASKEIVWLRRLLSEVGEPQKGPTTLWTDSQGAIAVSLNPELHKNTKHFDVKCHKIRELQEFGYVLLKYVRTDEQVADFLTKSLCGPQLDYLKKTISMTI